ncbi:MAG: DNA helicase RecQ [Magnetococcales bacterium]|nr:DNA helicase RecQ [Magnetococcales bacterium]
MTFPPPRSAPRAADDVDPALAALRRHFGYDQFRGFQRQVIDHVTGGGDALVLMPTGGGKSLCYQIPSLLRPGVGVVISPLIALMQDQVGALRQNGLRAAFVNSTQSGRESWEVVQQARAGELDLLYMAPERILTDSSLALLSTLPVALFAIDEAHCVSQWGHDFRPDYMGLSALAERFPGVPRLALTATADAATREEIVQRLRLEKAQRFVAGFDRPNIRYRIIARDNPLQQLQTFLASEHPGDSGIVYRLSRAKVEETADWLVQQGWKALPYHAGLDAEIRRRHQERFLFEEGVIIVATIAFGMGIDKPDVRFVAHLDLPKSLEAYYQETGRAGRDGLPAHALLTYGAGDVGQLKRFIHASGAAEKIKRVELGKLQSLVQYCESLKCRRQTLLTYFGEEPPDFCGNCDACLTPGETWDGLVAAQKALSCVFRTGQRFGAGHLIDVLLGKPTEKVAQFGHDQISTFGIGGELTPAQWRSVFRQLTARGLLDVDVEGHQGLRLNEKSRPVLRGEQPIVFRRDAEGGRPPRRRPSEEPRGVSTPENAPREGTAVFASPARAAAAALSASSSGTRLWEALRAMRLELAKELGTPPFMIFHDATLRQIAEHRPATLEQLGEIHGIGVNKLKNYGQRVLRILADHRP